MENFEFCVPTRLIVGRKQEENIGKIIKEYGFKNVLVVYGKSSATKLGLIDIVKEKLPLYNIDYYLFGGVEPNPKLNLVIEGIKVVKEKNIDFILAIGGGSAIDTAKLIAVGTYYEGNPYDFIEKIATPKKALPIGTILTISAAGSEMSTSCVVSDPSRNQKKGFNSSFVRPLFSILNPELTYTVNKYHTACGIVDIMMHTIERYFNPSSEYELADDIALSILKSVVKSAKIVMENPTHYEARRNIMLAGAISHNGITGIGKNTLMTVHQLEHALSGLYDFVAHGAGLAVLFPVWAMVYYKSDLKKFSCFAKEVMGINKESEEEQAVEGIIATRQFFKSLGMPVCFKDLGIENPDIEALLNILFDKRETIRSVNDVMDRKMAEKIYKLCLKEDF